MNCSQVSPESQYCLIPKSPELCYFVNEESWLVWLFAYLCVCSFFVGSGGVIFVSEKGLQLSDAAAHSGYLRADTRETI